MNAAKRNELKAKYKALAKEQDRRGDVVLREQAANRWLLLASAAEMRRAPKYLWWHGRER